MVCSARARLSRSRRAPALFATPPCLEADEGRAGGGSCAAPASQNPTSSPLDEKKTSEGPQGDKGSTRMDPVAAAALYLRGVWLGGGAEAQRGGAPCGCSAALFIQSANGRALHRPGSSAVEVRARRFPSLPPFVHTPFHTRSPRRLTGTQHPVPGAVSPLTPSQAHPPARRHTGGSPPPPMRISLSPSLSCRGGRLTHTGVPTSGDADDAVHDHQPAHRVRYEQTTEDEEYSHGLDVDNAPLRLLVAHNPGRPVTANTTTPRPRAGARFCPAGGVLGDGACCWR